MPQIERLLEELTNAYGPPGFEGPVRTIMQRELAPLSDEIETDGMGSLIASLNGDANGPRVMMAAHMDELGLTLFMFSGLDQHHAERRTEVRILGRQPHCSTN